MTTDTHHAPDPTCQHCDGEGTEVQMGPTGYVDGPCTHCHTDGDTGADVPASDPAPVVTFTTQEGAIFDMTYSTCPRCAVNTGRTPERVPGSGYLVCPSCGLVFDEPVFSPAEIAYMGQEEEPEPEPETRMVLRRWPASEGGEIIALMPDVDEGRGMIGSYMHAGQHGAADPGIVSRTLPVDPSAPDALALVRELEGRGYRVRLVRRVNRRSR